MLVTIVIIAVLVALLFPQAKKMIERGRMATCMGNLRTLAVGANLYAADNNGFLPWFVNSDKVPWEAAIAPYVGDYVVYGRGKKWRPSGPFTCPVTARKSWLGYGWNYQGLGHEPNEPREGPTKVGSKPKYVMIADSYYASDPVEEGQTPPTSYNRLLTPGNGKDKVPHSHVGGLNTVFVDGHAEWHPSDSWYDNVIMIKSDLLR